MGIMKQTVRTKLENEAQILLDKRLTLNQNPLLEIQKASEY